MLLKALKIHECIYFHNNHHLPIKSKLQNNSEEEKDKSIFFLLTETESGLGVTYAS